MKTNKTMLDILNERLAEGLSIKSIKETNFNNLITVLFK